jgi:hypothetical protein
VLQHQPRDRCRQRFDRVVDQTAGWEPRRVTSLPAGASKGKRTPGRLVVTGSPERQLSPTSDEVGRTQRMAHRQIGLTALSVQARNGTPVLRRSPPLHSEGQPDTTLRSWPVPYAGRNPRGRTPGNRTSRVKRPYLRMRPTESCTDLRVRRKPGLGEQLPAHEDDG